MISYLVFLLFLSLSAFSPYLSCNINVVVISRHLSLSLSFSPSSITYKFIYFSFVDVIVIVDVCFATFAEHSTRHVLFSLSLSLCILSTHPLPSFLVQTIPSLSLLLCHLNEHVGGEGLGTLDGQAKSTIPDEGGEHAEGTGNAKQYGVVVHLLHAVVLQQNTGVSIYIGPGVLDLAGFEENWRHHLVDLGDQLEQLIVGQMLEGELPLAGITRIGLAEHSMAIAGHNLRNKQGTTLVVVWRKVEIN